MGEGPCVGVGFFDMFSENRVMINQKTCWYEVWGEGNPLDGIGVTEGRESHLKCKGTGLGCFCEGQVFEPVLKQPEPAS